ncbi:uncharacterized protein LOC129224296 [Uloborus diversus]|uniref:uncharacterized protein LOC129224296 n=1 Tax=Uloborus diversus TaxID=327109 RepID=UPI00240A0B59|nr:uncharacterized protein LOC129224296 [Uloborus diversus]XP_054714704.1 uncharacterized protein LOC129224296 [Uloborus diversus]
MSRNAKDQFHQVDASAEEIRLVNERLKMRKALRAEYLRKFTDPHSTEPYVFDPQMQRFYSMHMTVWDRFIPTVKNWSVYMCTIILPVVGYALWLKSSKEKFEKKCRTGELEYKDRIFKFN